MVLYIDETENENLFIVTGLLVESEQSVELAYKRFKKSIKGINIPEKYKSKVYTEFKSVYLDHDYKKIKVKLLEEVKKLPGCIIFSCYMKKTIKFNQILKESVYITLMSSIISEISDDTSIIFDKFGKADFEKKIIESTKVNSNILHISPMDSQLVAGLQFVDNISSVIRMKKSNEDSFGYYDLIFEMIHEV